MAQNLVGRQPLQGDGVMLSPAMARAGNTTAVAHGARAGLMGRRRWRWDGLDGLTGAPLPGFSLRLRRAVQRRHGSSMVAAETEGSFLAAVRISFHHSLRSARYLRAGGRLTVVSEQFQALRPLSKRSGTTTLAQPTAATFWFLRL